MSVCNLTTPANYFHALRRQLKRNFRKPLVVFTPKSLLRHKLAVSPLSDMADGSRFQLVIPEIDAIAPPEQVRRVVLCSGKVYYDLLAGAARAGASTTSPSCGWSSSIRSRKTLAAGVLAPYRNADVVWCQEEPENMGAWNFVDRRIERVLRRLDNRRRSGPVYVGRDARRPARRPGWPRTHAARAGARWWRRAGA